MKTFQEMTTGDNQRTPLSEMAINWIIGQVKHSPTAKEQIEWAKERVDIDQLDKLDGLKLTNYFTNHETEFEYDDFLFLVSSVCGAFLTENGVKPTAEEQRFLDKMGY